MTLALQGYVANAGLEPAFVFGQPTAPCRTPRITPDRDAMSTAFDHEPARAAPGIRTGDASASRDSGGALPPRLAVRLACALALGLVAGCAVRTPQPPQPPPAASGDVAYRVVPPASEGRHTVARGQAVSGGKPMDGQVVLPRYPEGWLGRRLDAVTVDALVVVDESGGADRVDVDADALTVQCGDCADAFAQAVRDAVKQWRFAPLEIADWIDGPDEDGDGEPDSVTRGVVGRRPYSLRLQFMFVVREGRGEVEQVR